MIVYADKTDHLRKESYWPSYNIAWVQICHEFTHWAKCVFMACVPFSKIEYYLPKDLFHEYAQLGKFPSSSDPVIFNASGGREQVAKYGDWFSYDKTPRALIFKRDHSKVTDITSMTKLMRSVLHLLSNSTLWRMPLFDISSCGIMTGTMISRRILSPSATVLLPTVLRMLFQLVVTWILQMVATRLELWGTDLMVE